MINAAAADLIQRAYYIWNSCPTPYLISFKSLLRSVAVDDGTYLDSDVELAVIAIDELGLTRAFTKAQQINLLDEVVELFNALIKGLQDPDVFVDFDPYFAKAERFSRFDRGRFRGMVDAYMRFGPPPVMTGEEIKQTQELVSKMLSRRDDDDKQRRAMGFDDNDPVVG